MAIKANIVIDQGTEGFAGVSVRWWGLSIRGLRQHGWATHRSSQRTTDTDRSTQERYRRVKSLI